MIVNLYVDHLLATPPASSQEVWNATREHPKLYADAADRIGLTPSQYHQFREALLEGKATYVVLPRRLDAMAGSRRGTVYAVKNAYLTSSVHGWRVALADGNVVYVPQTCGNLSVLRPPVVAHVPAARPVAYAHPRKFVPVVAAAAVAPPPTPVTVAPPQDEAAPVVAAAPGAAAPAARGASPLLFLIPAALAGIVAGVSHSSPHAVPPCSGGSNTAGACTTK